MGQKFYSTPQILSPITNAKDAVNKEYVDAAVNKKLKDAVVAVSTENIDGSYSSADKKLTMTTPGAVTIDGVSIAEGNRVLLAGQTDGTQNGIYVLSDAANGVFTRAEDFNSSEKIPMNCMIPVAKDDSTWMITNDSQITLDSTVLTFGTYTGVEGCVSFSTTITGDGSATEFAVSHGLNTEDVVVQIVDHATKEVCNFDVVVTSANVVTIKSDVVLESTDTFDVTVIG